MLVEITRVLDTPGERMDFSGEVDLRDFTRLGEHIFPDMLSVTGHVVNRAGVVYMSYQIEGTMRFSCDRCQAATVRRIEESYSHVIVIELEDGSLDDIFIIAPNGQVLLDDIALNDIIPSLGQVLLCKEDCLGLCPTCGCDLNQSRCRCREQS